MLNYAKPEWMQPFEACQKCLCMMCYDFGKGCRACPFCFPFGGKNRVIYCRHFIPNLESKIIRDWYSRDTVLDTNGPFD